MHLANSEILQILIQIIDSDIQPQLACHCVKIDKMSVQFGLISYFDTSIKV